MKWFKHYTDAHDNNDLTKLRMRYGADGYAIYWYCLELIAGDLGAESNITFELKHDAEVIGFNLKIDRARVEEIMQYMIALNLFEQSESAITCLKIAKYLDKKTTRNSTIHRIIDAASMSATNPDNLRLVPDSPPTVPDSPGTSPLDTDTDTDTDRDEDKSISVGANAPTTRTAIAILDYLNAVSGKAFRPVKSNLNLIAARLKEGATPDDCRRVIERKAAEWHPGHPRREYLRPATLFNGEKFNQYIGEIDQPLTTGPEHGPAANHQRIEQRSAAVSDYKAATAF